MKKAAMKKPVAMKHKAKAKAKQKKSRAEKRKEEKAKSGKIKNAAGQQERYDAKKKK